MNRAFFDTTLGINWNMEPVDRSFDPDKVHQYLNLLKEPDQSFIADLIAKTTYVTYEQFKASFMKSFELFRQKIGFEPFYLVRSSFKIGSEDWLTALIWPELHTMNLVEIIDENTTFKPEGNINCLLLDDAIYTGISVFNKIDSLTYLAGQTLCEASRTTESIEIDPLEGLNCAREAGKYFTFHIVVPFVSFGGERFVLNELKALNSSVIMYPIQYMPGMASLIDIDKYYPGLSQNLDYNNNNLLSLKFGIGSDIEIEVTNMPLIYFDHKVAGPASTPSSIYLNGRLPNGKEFGSLFKVNPSREKIEQLEQLYESR